MGECRASPHHAPLPPRAPLASTPLPLLTPRHSILRIQIGGDDRTAIEYAEAVKDDGHLVITVGFGDATRIVMEQMASAPASSYALDTYGNSSECRAEQRLARGP